MQVSKNNLLIKILLGILFLISFFLRTYKLDSIPPGITNDEANFAYDAWLIAKTAKDQWGNFLPLQFKGFGDYRLPVYQYLIVPLVLFFGLKAWVIRLPTAIIGAASAFVFYLLVQRLFAKEKFAKILGLMTAGFLALNPWHFGLSRVIMEANVGLFFCLLCIYFYLGSKNEIKNFVLALLFAVLSFYTYYGYRFFLPLFLLFLAIKDKDLLRKNFPKKILIMVMSLILMTPIVLSLKKGGFARFKQVNFWQDRSLLATTNELRGECKLMFGNFFCRIFFNKALTISKKFLTNYFHHFSPDFLFFPEFEKGWGFLPPTGYFYLINFIPFILGVFFLSRKSGGDKLLAFLVLAPIADSLTGDGHFARSFVIIFPALVFVAYGWHVIYQYFVKKYKALFLFLAAIYGYFCLAFLINYFIYFPKRHSRYTCWEYQPLFEYLKQIEAGFDHIYISRVNHDTKQYIFYLYYFKVKPKDYFAADREIIEEDNGWVWVKKIEKFNFIDQPDKLENYPEKSLLVVDPRVIKGLSKPLKQIKYRDGKIAFNIYDLDEVKNEDR